MQAMAMGWGRARPVLSRAVQPQQQARRGVDFALCREGYAGMVGCMCQFTTLPGGKWRKSA
jgi:hypothetical protein